MTDSTFISNMGDGIRIQFGSHNNTLKYVTSNSNTMSGFWLREIHDNEIVYSSMKDNQGTAGIEMVNSTGL